MMEMELAHMITVVLLYGVMLIALWVFWFWFYQQYRNDKVRHELFKIRDEMFDYAATGKISFDDPAYRMLRQTFNGMIRFAHRTNIFTLIILRLVNFGKQGTSFKEKFDGELCRLDMANQEALSGYFARMNETVVKHIIKSSLIIMSVLVPLAAFLILSKGFRNLKKAILSKFPDISNLDNEAAIRGRAL